MLGVGSGKWEVGSGKWEVGSGKGEVGRGKWEVGSGKWEVGSGKWEVGSGKLFLTWLRERESPQGLASMCCALKYQPGPGVTLLRDGASRSLEALSLNNKFLSTHNCLIGNFHKVNAFTQLIDCEIMVATII